MNFIDRTTLGDTLAHRLQQLRGKDAVVVCLQESSLLTCLTMASQLHAWIYPLLYAPVYAPDNLHKPLGAFDQDGEFCPLPGDQALGSDAVPAAEAIAADQRKAAMESIQKQRASYDIDPDKHRLNGRHVILAADVLTTLLPVAVAGRLIASISPKSLTAAVGNATPDVAQLLRLSTGQAEILDVLTGIVAEDSRYFEHSDSYTPEQQHTLAHQIAAHWR